jgi:hypothetical protein
MLLEPEERAMVKGIIINKFRGDIEILKPGLEMLEAKTKCPVIGVLPMLDVDIEDEDSLSERLTAHHAVEVIDIAVIRTPRMSNYTDFNVFETIPGVSLRYVDRLQDLHNPDMIILPGSKNTIGDLKWMRQNGSGSRSFKEGPCGYGYFWRLRRVSGAGQKHFRSLRGGRRRRYGRLGPAHLRKRFLQRKNARSRCTASSVRSRVSLLL